MYPGSPPEHPPFKHANQTGLVKLPVAKAASCMLRYRSEDEGGLTSRILWYRPSVRDKVTESSATRVLDDGLMQLEIF